MNAVTDSGFGDERNFVLVRVHHENLSDDENPWCSSIDAEPNDEIEVAVFVSNSSDLSLAGEGTIKGLKATLTNSTQGDAVQLGVTLEADNAPSVWAAALVTMSSPVQMTYEPDSGEFYNHVGVRPMPSSFGDGVPTKLGYNSMDGVLPMHDPSAEKDPGSGWIMFRMFAVAP